MWRDVSMPLLAPGAAAANRGRWTSSQCHGIECPVTLVRQLAINNLQVDNATMTDGNCGVDAFLRGLLDQHSRSPLPANNAAIRALLRCKADSRIAKARADAVSWLRQHSGSVFWEGMSLKALCHSLSGISFTEYLAKMEGTGEWIDTCMLHALGCCYNVDVCVFQPNMDPALVGSSLNDGNCIVTHIVPVALVNDLHFWGVLELDETIQPVEKGDVLPQYVQGNTCRSAKRARTSVHLSGDDADDGDHPLQHLHEPADSEQSLHEPTCQDKIDAELTLCHTLARWDPWAAVTEELVQAVQRVAANMGSDDKTLAIVARTHAIQAIAYEEAHAQTMPDALKYQRAVRYCLQSPKQLAQKARVSRGQAVQAFLEASATTTSSLEDVSKILDSVCARGEQVHQCFQPFEPQVILNWRVLWNSLPKVQRKEHLLGMFAADLDRHLAAGHSKDTWTMNFVFMGFRVCRDAFLRLTGLGVSQLQEARQGAVEGKRSWLSGCEMGLYQSIRNTSKAKAYLSARQWLEHYAVTHAERSPMKFGAYLPGARKLFYWHHYHEDKRLQKEALGGWERDCELKHDVFVLNL